MVFDGLLHSGFSSLAELLAHVKTSCEQMVIETDAADLLPAVQGLLITVKTFMMGQDDPVRRLYYGCLI